MKLTAKQINSIFCPPSKRNLDPGDGNGLYLRVSTGVKVWRYRHLDHGVNTISSPGSYPDVSLKKARECCDSIISVNKSVKLHDISS